MDGIAFLIFTLLSLMIGPPIIFFIIGLTKRNTNKQASKTFFILAIVYLLIGGGICATMLNA